MNIYIVKYKEFGIFSNSLFCSEETFFTYDQAYRAYGQKVSKLNLEPYAEWTGASDMNLKAQHADQFVELICINV